MKVIDEIIRYLNVRGRLMPEDLAYLEAEGFYDSSEDDHKWCGHTLRNTFHEDGAGDEIEDRRTGVDRARVRQTGPKPRKNALKAVEISARIAVMRPVWADTLAPLVTLAQRVAPGSAGIAALHTLRQADSTTLARAIAAEMRATAVWFPALWKALMFDGYRACGDGGGSVAENAYRVILTGRSTREIMKYAWILRDPEIAGIHSLVAAQRQITRACGVLYTEHFQLIDDHLTRAYRSEAFWPYVLLYTATRYAAGSSLLRPSPRESRLPNDALPDGDTLVGAWEAALEMGRREVLAFMVFATRAHEPQATGDNLRSLRGFLPCLCPSTWYKSY